MKTKNVLLIGLLFASLSLSAQRQKMAILNIDVNGVPISSVSMGNLVRLEVEKTEQYTVLDKYDLAFLSAEKGINIDDCYGRICLVEAGKLLGADKMLSGRVEKFDNKIIVILRLIDVESGVIENTDIMEYLDLPELQNMVRISVNNIFGLENDQTLVEMLSSYEDPVNTPKTQLKLNGPRMGVAYIGGETGEILEDPTNAGGFDVYPVSTMFGYQFEVSYLSAGDFQALFEFITMINGMEQSRFVPSVSILNGLRSSKSGLEFAFGPVLEIMPYADGYYDASGTWHIGDPAEGMNGYKTGNRLDSRGDYRLATSWVWAVGKTFRSGYLNIPVNVYYKMQSKGYAIGLSVGFNVNRNNR